MGDMGSGFGWFNTLLASIRNWTDFVSLILKLLLMFASHRKVPGFSKLYCPSVPCVPGFGFWSTITPNRGFPLASSPYCTAPGVPAGTIFATAVRPQLRVEG